MATSITITRANVLADMKVKSHAEVASIKDDRERYLAELGSDKLYEANQCINDACAEVAALLRPVQGTISSGFAADNAYDTDDIAFAIEVTTRKPIQIPLTKAVHAYIVDAALAKYYVAVSHPEISERHGARIVTDVATINRLLFTKDEPTIRS